MQQISGFIVCVYHEIKTTISSIIKPLVDGEKEREKVITPLGFIHIVFEIHEHQPLDVLQPSCKVANRQNKQWNPWTIQPLNFFNNYNLKIMPLFHSNNPQSGPLAPGRYWSHAYEFVFTKLISIYHIIAAWCKIFAEFHYNSNHSFTTNHWPIYWILTCLYIYKYKNEILLQSKTEWIDMCGWLAGWLVDMHWIC